MSGDDSDLSLGSCFLARGSPWGLLSDEEDEDDEDEFDVEEDVEDDELEDEEEDGIPL